MNNFDNYPMKELFRLRHRKKIVEKTLTKNQTQSFPIQVLLMLFVFAFLGASHSFAAPDPPAGFAVEDVLVDIDQPIAMRFMPDGRLLLVQKKGLIQIGDVLSQNIVFDDYANLASLEHSLGLNFSNERGVLDIALDPNFPTEPYLYVLYTPFDTPDGARLTVSRFTHVENSGGTTSRLDLSDTSEVILWQDTDPYDSCCHFGGGIDFGPDGNLWFTTGDHFQGSYAASITRAGGGVHRIHKDGTIPLDNPFNDGAGPNVDSLIAFGLRNPFRARWDFTSNTLFVAEVGGNTQTEAWEDLHVIRYDPDSDRLIDDDFGQPEDNGSFDGINFGWPTVEGLPPFNDFPSASISEVGVPLFSYQHGGDTAAINGGVIYRGDRFPEEYQGAYFYADSTRDFVRYLKFNPDGSLLANPTPEATNLLNPDTLSFPFDLSPQGRIVAIEEGPDGALYYVSFTDAGGAFGQSNPAVLGALRRYVFDGGNTRPEVQSFIATPPNGVAAPLNVAFDMAFSDVDESDLNWQLDFGDGSPVQSGSITNLTPFSVSHSFQLKGEYLVRLTISDGSLGASATLTVTVGEAPTFTLVDSSNDNPETPAGLFRFGDTYTFVAAAEDSEGSALPASAFSWSSEFVRPGNIHPVEGPVDGITSYDFEIPNQGQGFSGPVFYRIFVTATDSFGIQTTESFEIHPQKSEIFFDTDPSGLVVQVDGNTANTTPFTLDTLVNFAHTITVTQDVVIGEEAYRFNGYSNGVTVNQQTYITPIENTVLIADYLFIGQSGLEPRLVTDGLILQLESNLNVGRGDGDDVSIWLDQSGLGNDFVSQGAPQFLPGGTPSGLPAITFDGVDDLLERINATDPLGGIPQGDGERSLFVVAKYSDPAVFGPGVVYGSTGLNEAFGFTRSAENGSLVVAANGNESDFNTGAQGLTDWSVQSVTTGAEEVAYLDGLEVSRFAHQYETLLDRFVIGQSLRPSAVDNTFFAVDDAYLEDGTLFDNSLLRIEENRRTSYLKFDLSSVTQTPLSACLTLLQSQDTGPGPVNLHSGSSNSWTENTLNSSNAPQPDGLLDSFPNFVSQDTKVSFDIGVDSISLGQENSFVVNHSGGGGSTDLAFGSDESSLRPVLTLTSETGPNPHAEMAIAAVLLFDRELTNSERLQVEGYLQQKYLGINTPPAVTVESPRDNSIFLPGQEISFEATATDLQDGVLADGCIWTSDLDGPLGNGCSLSLATLSTGVHTITVTASDNSTPPSMGETSFTLTIGETTPVQEGLVLHLESDRNVQTSIGNLVSSWNDQSSSRNDLAAVGTPRLLPNGSPTGQPIVALDGLGDVLARTLEIGTLNNLPEGDAERTLFVVSNYTGAIETYAGVAYGNDNANGAFGIVAEPNGGNFVLQGFSGSSDLVSSTRAIGAGWSVQTALANEGHGTLFKDGEVIADFDHSYATNVQEIVIGREIGRTDGVGIEVAAVLLYDRSLTALERETVEAYLREKYVFETIGELPILAITSPNSGQSLADGAPVDLLATASDFENGDLQDAVVWSSNIDGNLGSGNLTNIFLSQGIHTIIAEVTDTDGQTVQQTVQVTVSPDPNNLRASVIPPVTAGLSLQLETSDGVLASDGSVELWFDLSGQGNALLPSGSPLFSPSTLTTPTGLPAISLPNQTDSLARNVNTSPINGLPIGDEERTLFVVSNYTGPIDSFAGVSYGTDSANKAFGITAEPGNGNFVLQGFGGGNDLVSSTPALQQGWSIQTALAGGGTGTLLVDGQIAAQFTHIYNTSLEEIVIGRAIGRTGTAGLDISAVLLYNRVLSIGERESVEAYLRQKYIRQPVGEFPILTVNSPQDGDTFIEGESIALSASANDFEDGDINSNISWTSNLDGSLGTGPEVNVSLSVGNHTLNAFIIDSDDQKTQRFIEISVEHDLLNPDSVPPVTNGIVLQLESTDGIITSNSTLESWSDLSGLGNSLTAIGDPELIPNGTPTGLPALALDGQGDALQRVDLTDPVVGLPLGNNDRTVFVVSNFTGPTNAFAGVSYGTDTLNGAFGIIAETAEENFTLLGFGSGNNAVSAESATSAGWTVQTATTSNGVGSLFLDSSLSVSFQHTYNTTLEEFVIGREIGRTGGVGMEVAAVLIYDRTLSNVERQGVEDYLRRKYLEAVIGELPSLTITSPLAATVFTAGDEIDLIATATDTEDGDIASLVNWTSSLNGNLGTGPLTGVTLSLGTHTLIASVTDSHGQTVQQSIEISVEPDLTDVPVDSAPPLTDGLALHLESTDGVLSNNSLVDSWLDASGRGNTLFATGDPTLLPFGSPTGLPALELDGFGDTLERKNVTNPITGLPLGNDDRTVFVVSSYTGFIDTFAGVVYGTDSRDGAFGIVAKPSSGNFVLQGFGGNNDIESNSLAVGAGWSVQTATTSGGVGNLFLDGQLIASITNNYNTILEEFVVGRQVGRGGGVSMQIAAILVYDFALSESERLEVEDYLRQKYIRPIIGELPSLSIISPENNFSLLEGETLNLEATASDLEDGDLSASINWSSDIDGALGMGALIEVALSLGNHTLTASVTDEDNQTVEDLVTVSVNFNPIPGEGNSNPPTVDGLVLHLESTDGTLSTNGNLEQWFDLSGSGNNLFPSGDPILQDAHTPTGQPAIILDGQGDALERRLSTHPISGLPLGDDERTVFVVSNYTGFIDTYAGFAYGTDIQDGAFGIVADPNNGNFVLQGFGSQNDLATSAPAIGSGWSLQTAYSGGGTAQFLVDGEPIASFANTYNTTLEEIVLGREVGRGGGVGMEIAAVLVYDRILTETEQNAVSDYLTEKYLGIPLIETSEFISWAQFYVLTDLDDSSDSDQGELPDILEFLFGLDPTLQADDEDYTAMQFAPQAGDFVQIQYPFLGPGVTYRLWKTDLLTDDRELVETLTSSNIEAMTEAERISYTTVLEMNEDREFFQISIEVE